MNAEQQRRIDKAIEDYVDARNELYASLQAEYDEWHSQFEFENHSYYESATFDGWLVSKIMEERTRFRFLSRCNDEELMTLRGYHEAYQENLAELMGIEEHEVEQPGVCLHEQLFEKWLPHFNNTYYEHELNFDIPEPSDHSLPPPPLPNTNRSGW